MRLLNVKTLRLKDFNDNDVPRYAIASHRWLADEATYEDFVKERNTEKAGYQKVVKFCSFVKDWNSPRLEWLWIDTVCIDKRNSSEVAEAINTMFRYYAKSETCFAYLNDVGSLSRGIDIVDEECRRSIWFTRGWTLQELLAPKTVVFLNQEWEAFGSKGDAVQGIMPMDSSIEDLTGIPSLVLLDFKNSITCSDDEKWTWVGTRTTTKEEDLAYCLQGIFGIHMTVLYGEGGSEARSRLREKIRKKKRREKQREAMVRNARFSTLSISTVGLQNAEKEDLVNSAAESRRAGSSGKPLETGMNTTLLPTTPGAGRSVYDKRKSTSRHGNSTNDHKDAPRDVNAASHARQERSIQRFNKISEPDPHPRAISGPHGSQATAGANLSNPLPLGFQADLSSGAASASEDNHSVAVQAQKTGDWGRRRPGLHSRSRSNSPSGLMNDHFETSRSVDQSRHRPKIGTEVRRQGVEEARARPPRVRRQLLEKADRIETNGDEDAASDDEIIVIEEHSTYPHRADQKPRTVTRRRAVARENRRSPVTWYGSAVPPKSGTRVTPKKSLFKEGAEGILGYAAGALGAWTLLGLQRRKRKDDEEKYEYTSSGYDSQSSSASSFDRTTRAVRHSRRPPRSVSPVDRYRLVP